MNPGDPRTLDAYRYAENNPVSYTDASGLRITATDSVHGSAVNNENKFWNTHKNLNPGTGMPKPKAPGPSGGNGSGTPAPAAVPPVVDPVDPWQPLRDRVQQLDPDGPLGAAVDAAQTAFWKIAHSFTEYPSLPSLRRFIARGVPVIGAVIAGVVSFSDGTNDDRYSQLPLASRLLILTHRSVVVAVASLAGEAGGAVGGTALGGLFGHPEIGAFVGEAFGGNFAADGAEAAYDCAFDAIVATGQSVGEEALELGWSNDLPFVGCLDFPRIVGTPGGCSSG
jgi:hypothetical protein